MVLGRKYDKAKDTRKFLRFRAGYLLKYARFPRLENEVDRRLTNIINISEGGLMFAAYESLPVSSTLKVWFQFPGKQNPVETFAKVVSQAKVRLRAVYRVSLRFLDLNETDRELLRTFILQAAQDSDTRRYIDPVPKQMVKRRPVMGARNPLRSPPPPSLAAG